jgi:hypothetical protein
MEGEAELERMVSKERYRCFPTRQYPRAVHQINAVAEMSSSPMMVAPTSDDAHRQQDRRLIGAFTQRRAPMIMPVVGPAMRRASVVVG